MKLSKLSLVCSASISKWWLLTKALISTSRVAAVGFKFVSEEILLANERNASEACCGERHSAGAESDIESRAVSRFRSLSSRFFKKAFPESPKVRSTRLEPVLRRCDWNQVGRTNIHQHHPMKSEICSLQGGSRKLSYNSEDVMDANVELPSAWNSIHKGLLRNLWSTVFASWLFWIGLNLLNGLA